MINLNRDGRGLSYGQGVKHLSNHPTKEKNTSDKPTQGIRRKQSERISRIAYTLPIIIFCVLFSMVTISPVYGQETVDLKAIPIQPLEIGDAIPEELWDLPLQIVNHAQGKNNITLSEYSDRKLIVLDFWATWCAPCVRSLYKLDTLQREFQDDIIVVPITYQPNQEIERFLADKSINLPSVVSDAILKEIFPYHSIPHQVWLKDGKVLSITGHHSANRANFHNAVEDQDLKIIPKDELKNFDYNNPLTLLETVKDQGDLHFMSLLLPRIDARINAKREFGNTEFVMYNMTIPFMLAEVFLNHLPIYAQNETRIKFDIPPDLQFNISPNNRNLTGDYEEDIEFFQWADSFQFCYYLYSGEKITENERHEFVKSDLNRYFKTMFGITGSTAVVPTKSIYLAKTPAYKSLKSTGGESSFDVKDGYLIIKNSPIESLVASIQNYYYWSQKSTLPVVDATGLDYKIDLKIPLESMTDMDTLRQSLLSVGIEIKEGIKPIEMLIISDK